MILDGAHSIHSINLISLHFITFHQLISFLNYIITVLADVRKLAFHFKNGEFMEEML